jgi:hypothetical protein
VASDATQAPLQSSSPDGQAHALFWQVLPPEQPTKQIPQFALSLAVSTHEEPHIICPEGQLVLPPAPVVPATPVPVLPAVPGLPPVPGLLQAEARIAKQSPNRETRAVFILLPFDFVLGRWGGKDASPRHEAGARGVTACRRTS